jgi:hypothetical protein
VSILQDGAYSGQQSAFSKRQEKENTANVAEAMVPWEYGYLKDKR